MEGFMDHKINALGFALALAGTWGMTVVIVGLLGHFTGYGVSFMESVDSLYPGSGTGPKGILIALIFAIIHGAISGWLIAKIHNTVSD